MDSVKRYWWVILGIAVALYYFSRSKVASAQQASTTARMNTRI